ncbi:MAG: hypothetical protein ACREO7_11945 [Pseudoxanthomonas sp.]
MAKQSNKRDEQLAVDLSTAMGMLDNARVMARLAMKAEGLSADEARTAFQQMQTIMDDVHNEIDVVRETLEA